MPAVPARPRFLSSRREAPPPVARGAVRTHLRVRTGARGGREEEMEKREGGAGPARSLSSAPSEDPCGRPWRLTADVGPRPALALLRPLPLSPHPRRGGPWVTLFPDRPSRSVPFL